MVTLAMRLALEILIPAVIAGLCLLPLFIPDARFSARFPFITSSSLDDATRASRKVRLLVFGIAIIVGTAVLVIFINTRHSP